MTFLIVVVLIPALGTGTAVAQLAGAFRLGRSADRRRLAVAAGLLSAIGLLIGITASGGGYSPLGATYELIVASVVSLVGAAVLVRKPPKARRIAALLLVTAYPLLLLALLLGGSWISTGEPPIRFTRQTTLEL